MPQPGALPGLVVIGAPKAGTTSLAAWLSAHPQVRMSATKELEYLDLYYDRGVDWYRAQLPPGGPGLVVGEATPTYLGCPLAPERARATLPQARFVAVLREPVARAWSNYWYFCQLGVERRSWPAAVRADLRGGSRADYLTRGRYAEQVARWDDAVGPDRLLLLLFDDLLADPVRTFARVCRFAGVSDEHPPAQTGSVNPTSRPRSRSLQHALHTSGASRTRLGRRLWRWNAFGGPPPAMDPHEAARLRATFADDNARLAARLGRSLPDGWS
ncbi:MAG: sulfotransferase [Frankiales bacterium]|nr:sulfotransferase [Frankiales bacterium]